MTPEKIFQTEAGKELEPPQNLQPFMRHLSYRMTLLLMRTPITPNQITTMSLGFGLGAGVACLRGDYYSILTGAFLFLIYFVLDNCDGEIARLKDMRSEFGMRYDTFVGWLVHTCFFICLGWGAMSVTGLQWWFWTGIAAGFGCCVQYALELYQNKTQPHASQLTHEDSSPKIDDTKMDRFVLYARVIQADFGFIVLFLSLGGVLWYLLPPAAIGAQVIWCLMFTRSARRWHV